MLIRLCNFCDVSEKENQIVQTPLEEKIDQQYSKALEGFILVLNAEGDMVYLSESVSKYLGITQVSIFTNYKYLMV